MRINRRDMISASFATGVLAFAGRGLAAAGQAATLALSDAEWHRRLSPAAYQVLRRAGTEAPFTSPLLNEHHHGTFQCAGCAQPLFSSATKYDSGTGWPSFWRPLPGAVSTRIDGGLLELRTEVHCHRCAGHLGHVFDDGPAPTGQRYCMNGVALRFAAEKPR